MGKTTSSAGMNWNEAGRRILDWRICPRCDGTLGRAGSCRDCGADVTGPLGAELGAASLRVAEAIAVRQALVARLPTLKPTPHGAATARTATTPATATATATAAIAAAAAAAVPASASGSQISVQSVLAVAGAGLLAVAALVFTFLNPDLTSFATRTTIIAVITVLFIAGAWLFARRGLQFSAEAVGALAAVFAALDVWAFVQAAPAGVSGYVFAGIGTILASALFLWVGARARIRTWLWVAVVGIALAPGFFGAAGGTVWALLLGSLAVTIVVLGLHRMLQLLESRFDAVLGAERTTATVLQVGAVATAVIQLLLVQFGVPDGGPGRVLGSAAILAGLAGVAMIGSWNGLARFWSFLAGAFAAAAIGILPFAAGLTEPSWYLAVVPLATGVAVVIGAALRRPLSAARGALLGGARTVAVASAVPTVVLAFQQLFAPIVPLSVSASGLGWQDGQTSLAVVPPTVGLAVILGLAALAAVSWAESRAVRRSQGASPGVASSATDASSATNASSAAGAARTRALWLAMLMLLTVTGWAGFDTPVQSITGFVLAAGLSLSLVLIPALSAAGQALRRPLIVGAHLLLLLAALLGWLQQDTAVWVGAAAVLVLGIVSLAMPARHNPTYVGVGYAYALIIVATALSLAQVEPIAVLCLTTALALLVALGVTVTTWLSPRSWYATLLVSAVPFVLGVVAVLLVRSGWTALSTGLAFALALTLMVTRRTGMTVLLRAAAAALLVPSLSVVVVCLGAQVFASSGSPIVLPIIAAIVACTLPATGFIADSLRRHGLPAVEADAARTWIEISAVVTAVLTVILALVRTAAGLPTTFLVLVILGAGAAATAFTTRRRHAWLAAAASWTGALWCVWAIQGVNVLEPYLLPPALAAVIVGAITVALGRADTALFATGLAVAVVPSVIVLAVGDPGAAGTMPWRTYGLLGAAMVLIVLSALAARTPLGDNPERLRSLGRPTLVAAIIAAGAGAVQAVRWGGGVDALALDTPTLLMVQVLVVSAIAAILAGAAGYLFAGHATATESGAPSRWPYAAAMAFLVVGPITAIRFDVFSIATLMLLTLGLLGFMLVVVARARTTATTLPPAGFIFALAWCTAVAGWSERELRVEAFSLPLGLALLCAGIIAMRPLPAAGLTAGSRVARASWMTWPNGFVGSWRVLAPGIVVTFLPSVLATGTDPQTWRAILVMSLALAAILIGSVQRLAAPFVLGLAVLPIEIIVVFTVQIGQTINPLLWWITLAAAGAVLLVIAITSERKGADAGSFTARMRDLS